MKTTITPNNTNYIKEMISLIQKETFGHSHVVPNILAIKDFIDSQESNIQDVDFLLRSYHKGDTIVHTGLIADETLKNDIHFRYAQVPLGYIIQGDVTVLKGGKATKQLTVGDFVGLFETSDWYNTQESRHIGDWTLIVNSDTQIFFFSREILQKQNSATENFKTYLVELARNDAVPQPISKLPLLDWTAKHTTKSRLPDYVIVAHTHLLPNNIPLFRHLAHLVGFGRMYVLEKPYSTVPEAHNELIRSGVEVVPVKMEPTMPYAFSVQRSLEILWQKLVEEQKGHNFKHLLIVDDGGDVILSIPWEKLKNIKVTAVEQTQRGITRVLSSSLHTPPIVSVASSGIKKNVESIFIGASIVKKLDEINLLSKEQRIGILGMGSIGLTIRKSLLDLKISPLWYDVQPSDEPAARTSIDSLINNSDIIIGTTGSDALKGIAFERIHGHKIFISASSADIEFASVLKLARTVPVTPFDTIHIQVHETLTIDVLNGGYPINFDRLKDATPSEDIVLTRCLMYIGIMQAIQLISSDVQTSDIYTLDPMAQKKVLEQWIIDKNKQGNPPNIPDSDVEKLIQYTTPQEEKNMVSIWNN